MRRRALVFCFFFQAEDGIRDYKVTGVQTCALPICAGGGKPRQGVGPGVAAASSGSPSAAVGRPTSRHGTYDSRGGGDGAPDCAARGGAAARGARPAARMGDAAGMTSTCGKLAANYWRER